MAIVSSAIGYAVADDNTKDVGGSGSTFDFTRRKKWPQLLLQELAGAALFCLKPVIQHRGSNTSGNGGAGAGAGGQGQAPIGWKTIYISPGANDMLSIKGSEFENRDFFDIIYAPDQAHLQLLFQSLISPAPPLQRGSLGIHSGSSSGGSGSGTGSGSAGGSTTDSTNFGYGASLGMSHAGGASTGLGTGSSGGAGAAAGHRGVGGHGNGAAKKGPSSTAGKSFTTYARINAHGASSSLPALTLPGVSAGSAGGVGTPTAVWEIRAHATGVQGAGMNSGAMGDAGNASFGMGNSVQGQGQGWYEDQSLKGKAVWVMGRKVADGSGEDSVQSLDIFLELKLENERLREELRDLQYEMDDDDLAAARAYSDASALRAGGTYPSTTSADPSSPSDSSFTSSSDELSGGNGLGAGGPGQGGAYGLASGSGAGRKKSRPSTAAGPGGGASATLASSAAYGTSNAATATHLGAGSGTGKDKDRDGREKKRAKKQHAAVLSGAGMGQAGLGGMGMGAGGVDKIGTMPGLGHGHGHGKGEAEGMHVCVTCGRTDSPEWRKGPLGPKTLCNACGLRWAKRNSTAPSRKEKKAAAEAKKKAAGV